MVKKSAGILIYRKSGIETEVFLVHPGGPFWAKKDLNSWSIPKGIAEENEDLFAAAKREFKEETGMEVSGDFKELQPTKTSGNKIIYSWAIEGDVDALAIISNTFELEWPPKSGIIKQFPEVDKAGWFSLETAKQKIVKGQLSLLEQLERLP
jgi:predicted NUDIX family NTP pyrophosphohydrolase